MIAQEMEGLSIYFVLHPPTNSFSCLTSLNYDSLKIYVLGVTEHSCILYCLGRVTIDDFKWNMPNLIYVYEDFPRMMTIYIPDTVSVTL